MTTEGVEKGQNLPSKRDQLLKATITSNFDLDKFSELFLQINKMLMVDDDFINPNYKSLENFKRAYQHELGAIASGTAHVVFPLEDNFHRIVIDLDSEYPEDNQINLSQRELNPMPEVLERWNRLSDPE